jgi:hypothetical protein
MTEWTKDKEAIKAAIYFNEISRDSCCGPCSYEAMCGECTVRIDYQSVLKALLEYLEKKP